MSLTKTISHATMATSQRGAGLIEVLISLLVISTGVLGLTAIQANGLTSNRTAYYRTQATVLAYDIIDRARANQAQAIAGSYTLALGATLTGSACSSACSAAQIASVDLLQWKTNLASQLPNGDGSIAAITGVTNGYLVSIDWAGADNKTKTLSIGMQL